MDVGNLTKLELVAKLNEQILHPLIALMAVYGIYLFVAGLGEYNSKKKTNEDMKKEGSSRMEKGLIFFIASFLIFTVINYAITVLGE